MSTVRSTEIESTRLIPSIQTLEIEPIYACLIRTRCSNEDALEAITGLTLILSLVSTGVEAYVLRLSAQRRFNLSSTRREKFVFSERERLPDNVVEDNENRIQCESVCDVCVFSE